MLTDPALLFCDEPTTGLDSYSAFSVIEQLRQLAARGKVVICTIHQPASGIFDMFQSVYLLVSGGKLALTCPVADVAPFFQRYRVIQNYLYIFFILKIFNPLIVLSLTVEDIGS